MKVYKITLETTLKDEENVNPRLYNLIKAFLPYIIETEYLLSDSLEQVAE